MANHANSTRTPLLPPLGAPPPLLPARLGRQPGPVTQAIRTMRAADPDTAADDAIEAIRQGLDRYFSEADRQRVRELRRALADRIEADLAALDALGGDVDFEDENEHGGDIQDEPHDPEEDRDDDAIIDHASPRRYRSVDTRKRELICEARMGLDAVRRRKARVAAPVGALRVIPAHMLRALGL